MVLTLVLALMSMEKTANILLERNKISAQEEIGTGRNRYQLSTRTAELLGPLVIFCHCLFLSSIKSMEVE